MKKPIFYSALGGVLEFYDFIIFAIFANAITQAFFPADNRVAGLLLTFSVFAAGYIVRPIGGVVFGHFGDKYGRKKTFTYSIIIMALSTILIAFIPSYSTIGVLAPIILTILRLLQGASIGGEIPGAITFISETAVKSKTLACSVVFFGLVLGIILGELIHLAIVSIFLADQVMSFGWRVAFLIGGIFGVIGFYLRKKLVETSFFEEMEQAKVDVPVVTLITKYYREIFVGWALMGLVAAGIMVLFLIMPAYAKLVGIPAQSVLFINTLILFLVMSCSVVFGYLGDKVDKRFILIISSATTIIFSYIVFKGLVVGSLSLVVYVVFCLFSFGAAVAVVPVILAESFPTEVRYTGVGVVYNLSFATTGGLAPVIIFYLISATNNIFIPAFYFVVIAILSILGIVFYPKDNIIQADKN